MIRNVFYLILHSYLNANEAAAIGEYNVIGQQADQTSVQGQTDINQYLPSH